MVRLAVLLICVGLATSRIGLVAHEFVGHGGAAVLAGGEVLEVHLFWFAGGWIRYQLATPSTAGFLFVAMGGIAIELVIGTLVWALARRRTTFGARVLGGLGITFVVHALWYLSTGAWHGYGDGILLHRVLGDARPVFAIAVGLVACAAAYVGARGVLGAIAGAIPGSRRAKLAGVTIAAIVAAVVNIGLDLGELRLRRDVTYTATMRPERDRLIASELARWQEQRARQNAAITEANREAERHRLETEHRTFPFAALLAAGLVAAIVAGARRTRPGDEAAIPNRLLARAAVCAAVAISCVIAIDLAINL